MCFTFAASVGAMTNVGSNYVTMSVIAGVRVWVRCVCTNQRLLSEWPSRICNKAVKGPSAD